MKRRTIKILSMAITVIFLSSCSLTMRSNKSTNNTTVVAATPTPTPTPTPASGSEDLSGYWSTACGIVNTWGLKAVFKISGGLFSNAVMAYPGRTSCTGNPAILNMDTFQPILDFDSGAALTQRTVTGAPAGFTIWVASGNYSVVYRTDSTHINFLTNVSTVDRGAAWSSWTAASPDIAGFEANPTTFTPTSSSNIALVYSSSSPISVEVAPTLASFEGVWDSVCLASGSDGIRRTLVGLSNGNQTFFIRTWTGNTSCTGAASVISTPLDLNNTLGSALTDGKYEWDVFIPDYSISTFTLIQKSGDYLFGSKSAGASDDGTTAPKRHTIIDTDYAYLKQSTVTTASIYGTWISNCADKGDGTSFRNTTVYSAPGNFINTTENWATNTTCTGAASSTDAPYIGTYSIGAKYKTGYKFDAQITSPITVNTYITAYIDGNYMYHSTVGAGPEDASSDGLRTFVLPAEFYYVKQ